MDRQARFLGEQAIESTQQRAAAGEHQTAVHEVGHSVGLGHDTISAMKSGEITDTSLTWRTYSAADIADINSHY